MGAGAQERPFFGGFCFLNKRKHSGLGGRDSEGPGSVTGMPGNVKGPLEQQPGGRQQPPPQSRSGGTGVDAKEGPPPPTSVLIWPTKRKAQGAWSLGSRCKGHGAGGGRCKGMQAQMRLQDHLERGHLPTFSQTQTFLHPQYLGFSDSSPRPPSSRSNRWAQQSVSLLCLVAWALSSP